MSSPRSRLIAYRMLQLMDSDNGAGRDYTFNTLDNMERLSIFVEAMRIEGWLATDEDVYQIICGEQMETLKKFEEFQRFTELDKCLTEIFDTGSVPKTKGAR